MAKMKVTQVPQAGADFEIVEREIPEPGPGQVRIRVQACGVCHSDVLTKEGGWPGLAFPRVPGHEVAGVIDEAGPGVTQWKQGQRVGVGWHGGQDGTCLACRRGDFVNCANLKVTGVSYDGGYQEYMIAPVEAVARMPESLDPPEAAPLLCAGITTFNALLIVDPYNDFMSAGGKFYEATRKTAEAVGFYDNMRQLVPAIRAARIQVIIVPHHRWRPGDYVEWKHVNPTQVRASQSQGFAAGSWGGEFHPEFGPKPGDVVALEHWGQSDFANTDLHAQLTQRGIEKIIIVGFVAKTCIESTARFGMELGYHVTLVKDATAAFHDEGTHAAHEVNGPRFAHAILTTEELLARLP